MQVVNNFTMTSLTISNPFASIRSEQLTVEIVLSVSDQEPAYAHAPPSGDQLIPTWALLRYSLECVMPFGVSILSPEDHKSHTWTLKASESTTYDTMYGDYYETYHWVKGMAKSLY